MKKRLLPIILASAMLMGICSGCGDNKKPTEDDNSDISSVDESDNPDVDSDSDSDADSDSDNTTSTDMDIPSNIKNIVMLDLSEYFNKCSFASENDPKSGNFDDNTKPLEGISCYISEEVTNEEETFADNDLGINWKFQWSSNIHTDGANDTLKCQGQTITLPEPLKCNAIGMMGASANYGDGLYVDATFIVNYTDGTTEKMTFSFPNWTRGTDYVVVKFDNRWNHSAVDKDGKEIAPYKQQVGQWYSKAYYWGNEIKESNMDKLVESITCPDSPEMNLFAISLRTCD